MMNQRIMTIIDGLIWDYARVAKKDEVNYDFVCSRKEKLSDCIVLDGIKWFKYKDENIEWVYVEEDD